MLPNNHNYSFQNLLFLICKSQWFLLSDTVHACTSRWRTTSGQSVQDSLSLCGLWRTVDPNTLGEWITTHLTRAFTAGFGVGLSKLQVCVYPLCPCPTWALWLQYLKAAEWKGRAQAQGAYQPRPDVCPSGLVRPGWRFLLRDAPLCVWSSPARGGGCQCDPQTGRVVADINRAVLGRNPKAPTHPIHPDHICLPARSCAPSPPAAAAAVPALLRGWWSQQTAWRHPRRSTAGCSEAPSHRRWGPSHPQRLSISLRAGEAPAVWESCASKNKTERSKKLRIKAAFQARIVVRPAPKHSTERRVWSCFDHLSLAKIKTYDDGLCQLLFSLSAAGWISPRLDFTNLRPPLLCYCPHYFSPFASSPPSKKKKMALLLGAEFLQVLHLWHKYFSFITLFPLLGAFADIKGWQ